MRSNLLKRIEFIENHFNSTVNYNINIGDKKTVINGNPSDRIYIPSDTAKTFHEDNSFVKLVIGPYGSGKSTMCAMEIIRRTCQMPKWHNGRRKARWAVVRNTSGELVSTTLQTWLTWFGDLGDITKRQKPILTYEHTFNDGEGVVELELIFLALDRPDDVRKVKSLELTGVYLNELSELPQNALAHFKGRVNGRYPSRSFCADFYWSGIIADTNPPSDDHWIYRDFESGNIPDYRVFHQPPGLLESANSELIQNPNCDNAPNLSADYYVKLASGQTKGFIDVYCMGKYGLVESGKRCYPEYNDDIHSVDKLEAIQGEPLHLAWDFGLTPACVVSQFTARGQLKILKEYVSEDMGIRSFAKSIVIPSLAIDFPYCKVGESEADPSGNNSDTIMEEMSCIGELNSLGLKTQAASTNDIETRLGSVRFFLNTMTDGQPAFMLSRQGCPTLRKGFISGYHFKRLNIGGEDRYHDKPNKNSFSHCFVGETLVKTPHGCQRIDSLKVNDLVLTPFGKKRILATMSSQSQNLVELTFSNGMKIISTDNHPFITSHDIVRADSLEYNDLLLEYESEEVKQWADRQNIKPKNLMELNIIENQCSTINPTGISRAANTCIEWFGNFIMALFPTVITFTTSTMTEATMSFQTYNSLAHQNMRSSMAKNSRERNKRLSIWRTLGLWQALGINQKMEENGIRCTVKNHGVIERSKLWFVNFARKIMKDIFAEQPKVFAQEDVSQSLEGNQVSMTSQENAPFVKKHSSLINTLKSKPVLRCVQVKRLAIQEKVYDLTIEDSHCFFVNDVLVSNCHDALQYISLKFAADAINQRISPEKPESFFNPTFRYL